jgi:hypothetical protein
MKLCWVVLGSRTGRHPENLVNLHRRHVSVDHSMCPGASQAHDKHGDEERNMGPRPGTQENVAGHVSF